MDGVGSFSVSLLAERGVVMHDPAILPAEKIVEMYARRCLGNPPPQGRWSLTIRDSIESRGFSATILSTDIPNRARRAKPKQATTTIKVEGMTCGACTAAIEGGFKGVAGVTSFTVSLITERAVAVHDPDVVSKEKVLEMYGHQSQLILQQAY